MDFFNSLWEDPEQTTVPSSENFAADITPEKWINQSSTYKLISGNFKHPHESLGLEKYFTESPPKKRLNVPQEERVITKRKQDMVRREMKPKEGNLDETQDEDASAGKDCENDTESLAESTTYEWVQTHCYVPGLRKNPVNDTLSCMDINEHAECLSLYLKFSKYSRNVIMPSDRSDHVKFEVMYKKIQEEQKAYSQGALKQWSESAKDTQIISDAHMRPLQLIWMLKTQKALEYYPHIYKRRLMVPLLSSATKIEMMKMSDLLQMGRIPVCSIPGLKCRTKPSTTVSKMLQSARYNLLQDQYAGSLHKLPVSLDSNAESLARLHKAQIVISSGALNTLVETHFDFSKSWTLPISVKEYRTIEKGKTTTKTIVFIDKPLPKQPMTANECYRFIFKHAVKGRLLDSKHQMCFTFPIPGVDPLEREQTTAPNETPTDGDAKDSIQEVEESAPEKTQNEKLKKENRDVSSVTDAANSEDENLVIAEEDPAEPPKTNEVNKESVSESYDFTVSATSAVTGASNKKQASVERKDGLKLPKTSEGYTAPISNTNVTYSSWVIRPESDEQLSVHQKKTLKELSVIIRCRVDGCQRIDNEFAALSVLPKLEYQLEFAAEEPTKEELVREWTSLFFKPASHVLRTRVDVKDNEIIMFEKKDKCQIAAEAQRMHGIRPVDSLQTLYSVFFEVSTLTKGSYLLHHSPEENAFASLEESIQSTQENSKSVRNLEDCFGQKLSVTFDPNPTWRKLDCTLVLPRHKALHVMPCTYRPKPSVMAFKARNIPRNEKIGRPDSGHNRKGYPTKKKSKKKKRNNRKKINTPKKNNESPGEIE